MDNDVSGGEDYDGQENEYITYVENTIQNYYS